MLQELRGFDCHRIRNVDDIFVSHLECFSQEVSRRIAKIHIIDHWDYRPGKLRAINPNPLCNLTRFTSIQEYGRRICTEIGKAARLTNGFRKGNSPSIELELPLQAGSTECQKGLRLV